MATGSERYKQHKVVVVRVEAPVELPLRLPGAPTSPRVSADGSAVVRPDGS